MVPFQLPAQRTYTASVDGMLAEHRVTLGSDIEKASGPIFGASISTNVLDWLAVGARVSGGTLLAEIAPAEDRSMGEIGVQVDAFPIPSIGLATTIAVRGYSGTLGRQRWIILATGPELRLPLYEERVRGSVRLALMPLVAVSDTDDPERALAGTLGVEYRGQRLAAEVSYSLERFDFPAEALAQRLEQLSTLSLRIGWRIRR